MPTSIDVPESPLPASRCRAVLASLSDPCLVLDPVRDAHGQVVNFVYADANPAACRSLGRTHDEVVGARFTDLHADTENRSLFDGLRNVAETGESLFLADWSPANGGSLVSSRHFEVRAERVLGSVSEVRRDVTDRVTAMRELAESERRFRLMAENAMDLVLFLDPQAHIDWVSGSVITMLGYRPQELEGVFVGVLVHPDDLPLLLVASDRSRAGDPADCRIRMTRMDGTRVWVDVVPRAVSDESGTLLGQVLAIRDVEREVLAQRALAHALEFDTLTGLAKRIVATRRIDDALDVKRIDDWALLCLGVNGMRAINQAYTHAGGDEVLKTVAQRLVAAAGSSDRVARVAGDEFVVLLPDVHTLSEAALAAERILSAVRGPVYFLGDPIDVTGSAGIVLTDEHRASELLRDATAAMRQSGAHGRDTWSFLAEDVGAATRKALEIQVALRAAVAAGQISAWFMPIVSFSEGRTIGYEALARWILSDGTVVAPADFLEAAEHTGLILSIDRVVMEQALDHLAAGRPDTHLSLNVSAATLADPRLADTVTTQLQRTGVDASRLHLEVTESTLLEVTPAVRHTMAALADLGVTWWVDDFGTGYSSISHLRDLPISGLKLDQSFTSALTDEGNSATRLAHGLVGLAEGLSLATVAEGVETESEARILAAQGWQMGQGWLYGKAQPGLE